MLNRVTLIGTIASEPKYKEFPNGGTIASFNVLTQKFFKDTAGQPICKNAYNRVCVRNTSILPHLIPHLKENAKVYIEGELETRSWVDGNGQKQYITEVSVSTTGKIIPVSHFIEDLKESQTLPKENNTLKDQTKTLDDDIPF